MIQTIGLTKDYGDFTAVKDLNLHVEKGEIYGFLGPNGAGKTTTILMLLGLVKPTRGEVRLFGKTLKEDYFGLKRRIGVVSEVQYMYEEMTAWEYLCFFADLYGVKDKARRVSELLERVQLYDWRNEMLRGYSKGMTQKIGVVRALLHDPDILIMDEPVSSLDPYGIKEVRDLIKDENQKGKTILISSHLLSEVERTCHRVGIMNAGTLVAEDTMDNIRTRLVDEIEIEVELEAAAPEILQAVSGLPFVKRVQLDGKILGVSTNPDKDYRLDISRAIAAVGGVVVGLNRKQMSLEDAFITITEKHISQLTGKEA
ncbi:MAG: ABC transporter ATP-binding protein [Firmicutes bacterium]|nr:ABC transporter ATP-binding protein [Bacillota bacterium]